jgi:hypothetical protein
MKGDGEHEMWMQLVPASGAGVRDRHKQGATSGLKRKGPAMTEM